MDLHTTTRPKVERLTADLAEVKAALDTAVKAAEAGDGPVDTTALRALTERATSLKAQLVQAQGDEDIRRQIEALGHTGQTESVGDGTGTGPVARKSWPGQAAKAIAEQFIGAGGTKALPPSGAIVTGVPAPFIVPEGRPTPSIRNLVPTTPTTSTVVPFWRQTARDNNAAPVAPGTLKPVSNYDTVQVQLAVVVIAHVSNPIDRFALVDNVGIEAFLRAEMLFGYDLALEDEIINGPGGAGRFEGLLNTPGTQVQAFDTDAPTSVRKALTALENEGLNPSGIVMNPGDWEAVELALTATQATTATGIGPLPIQPAARLLWGVPVVLSTALAAGTAIAADFATSTQLFQRDAVTIDWSDSHGDTFQRNQLTWRCEGRAAFGVLRPAGVVEVTVAGTP